MTITTLIPDELKQLDQWVTWRLEGQPNSKGDLTKMPINPHTGQPAKSNNPATWGTLDQALARYRRGGYAGVGFVFTTTDPYCGVDLDDCVDASGAIDPLALSIIQALNSYSEISPSGTGVKIFCTGSIPKALKKVIGGIGLEMYDQGRYFAVTGQHVPGTPTTVNDAQAALMALLQQYAPAPAPMPPVQPAAPRTASSSGYPEPFAKAVIDRVITSATSKVASAPDGHKHNERLAAGELLGGYIASLESVGLGHLLSEDAAARLLFNANIPQANQAKEVKAIRDAITHGRAKPCPLPIPNQSPPLAGTWLPSANAARPASPTTSTQNQRYTTIPAVTTTALGVQAAMGTGKSYAVARQIPANASVLVLTHRVALAQQQADQFDTDFYQDHRHALNECQRLVITPDSLIKLDPAAQFDYVVIDESEQALRHITGGTIKPNDRATVLQMVEGIVTRAKHVYYLDADLGALTYGFMERMHGADDCTLLINTYQPADRTYVAMPRKEDVTVTLKANLTAGQTAYVAINSRKQVHALALDLQTTYPELRVLAISSQNSNTPEIQHVISTINTEILKYDVVIASPSLGTGISIDAIYFDAVYLLGEAKTNTHTDLLQMAGRVRTIKSGQVYCWIAPQQGDEETNPATLRQQAIDTWQETGVRINIDRHTGAITSIDADYLDLWVAIQASRNASLNNLAANVYARAAHDGHAVIRGTPASEQDRRAAKAASKAARSEIDRQWHDQVITAAQLTPTQYDALQTQFTTTPEEQAQITQYEICQFYELAPAEITPELLAADERGLKRKVKALALLADEDLAVGDDLAADDHLIADQHNQTLARDLRIELFSFVSPDLSLSLTNDDQPGDTAIVIPPEFDTWLTANADRLKRVLGLAVGKLTPIQFIGRTLTQLGLKSKVTRHNVNGETQRTYIIDPESLAMMRTFAGRYADRKHAQQAAALALASEPAPPPVAESMPIQPAPVQPLIFAADAPADRIAADDQLELHARALVRAGDWEGARAVLAGMWSNARRGMLYKRLALTANPGSKHHNGAVNDAASWPGGQRR